MKKLAKRKKKVGSYGAWKKSLLSFKKKMQPKPRKNPVAGSGHFYRVTAHITEGKKTVVSKFRLFASSKPAAIESVCKLVGIPRSCIQSAKIIPRNEKKK